MNLATVVFGGSGFIGTHLIRHLVESDTAPVISIDLEPPREVHPGVDYLTGDVRNLDCSALPFQVGRIFNLAAVHTTPGHPDYQYYETNVLGALAAVRLAVQHGASEIVFTSSISVYGPSEETKTEESQPAPVSAYGRSKLMAECIHRQWQAEGRGRRLVIVRPAVVFGPGECGNFTRLAGLLRSGVFVYPGRKDTVKACIYIDDLIDAMEYARTCGEDAVLFNASYPVRYTLEDIVGAFTSVYFPEVKAFILPYRAVMLAAAALKLFDVLHLGVHPERVMKLVRSTDIYPGWLMARQYSSFGGLSSALSKWAAATDGTFR